MSIKYRLILSYIGMIVIPIIFIILLNFTFSFFLFNESDNLFGALMPAKKFGKYNVAIMEFNRKINIELLNNKNNFLNRDFMQHLDEELKEFYSGIVVRKDKEIFYASEFLKDIVDLDDLPKFKEEYNRPKNIKYKHGYVINTQADYYVDGSQVSIFVIVNFGDVKKEIDKAASILSIGTICILIITTLILTYSVYKNIIKSITKLRHAAIEMKNGNLDYRIEKHLNDEIGDLSLSFEEMRLKLKDSLETQKKYEENRKTLISNISHDLKTPIMSIKGHIEGIKDGIANSPEKLDKYIDTIYEKSKDMELLINELFLFSRLDLEKEEFNFQIVDIIEFLEFSIEDLSFDLEKVGGQIRLIYDQDPIFVKVDLLKLKRVILNIVSNSIKYRGEDRLVVKVNVKNIEDQIIIGITDNGKGISQENLSLIFDRFYRADKSRNTSIVGSGLGLAISRQIIEKHGGKIWAESKENVGTSIFFSLKQHKEGEKNDEENINN